MEIDYNLINTLIQTNISTAFLHQKFNEFKACNTNKDVVIVASGPTAKQYIPIPNAIHIGVNRSFQTNPNLHMDYIFLQDYSGKTPEYIDEVDSYNCQKFYGLTAEWDNNPNRVVPESHALKANAIRYRTGWMPFSGYRPKFVYDISTQPLGCFGSVVFPALQFALWTNPKRVYLVGCDCTESGYAYNDDKNSLCINMVIPAYKEFKLFAHKYYPNIEIISINPVGLKGIFKGIER